jgi:hypothetical protein
VPARQAKSIGIRSLPADAEPSAGSKPLFRGVVQEKLSFRVVTPEADDYVLVLSNRAGKEAVNVEAEIRTLRRRPKPPPENYSPRPQKAGWATM